MKKLLLAGGLLAGALAIAADSPDKDSTATEPADGQAAEAFYFRDGDRIVAAGDSITLGGHYLRYIENFIRTRYPEWRIMVRSAGVNGMPAEAGLLYMDDDVLPWKPTVVVMHFSVAVDHGKGLLQGFKDGVVAYADKLLQNRVRVVLCSRTPLDLGDEPNAFTKSNRTYDEMAKWTKGFAKEKGLPFVDEFHFLHTLWGLNRHREFPVSVTRATLYYENQKRPKPLPVGMKNDKFGDDVHPAPAGHMTMAYNILKSLHAPAEVSSATIDVMSGEIAMRNCTVTHFKVLDRRDMETYIGGTVKDAIRAVSFERKDEASPCWIEGLGAAGLELVPFQQELNRMPLRVMGLFPGTYQLKIDGFVQGFYTDQQLADGINLSENRGSPLYEPGRKVERLVSLPHSKILEMRDAAFGKGGGSWSPSKLDDAGRKEMERGRVELEKRDLEIAQAGQPVAHTYEITVADFEK